MAFGACILEQEGYRTNPSSETTPPHNEFVTLNTKHHDPFSQLCKRQKGTEY